MSASTFIEWTDATWNPVTGCSKVSDGCKNCYAERMAHRLKLMGVMRYAGGFDVTLQEDLLELPLKWRKPARIFVNSMSDLFHHQVPDEFIHRVFETMKLAHWHQFQILTKRASRIEELNPNFEWPSNVWMGVSVENSRTISRIDSLRNTNSRIKFVSIEPLLESVGTLNLQGIDWVIVGGESGPYSRPVEKDWVIDIKNQCAAQQVPFFFKQWGGKNKHLTGRLLEGRTWDEMPVYAKRHNPDVI